LLKEKKLKQAVKFIVLLNLLSLPIHLITFFKLRWVSLQIVEANLIKFLLSPLTKVKTEGPFLFLENEFVAKISWDSTGWKSFLFFIALILATPVNFKRKFFPILVGLPAIFFINLARILTTILIALKFGISYFEIVHSYLWRWCTIFVTIFLWFLWLQQEFNIRWKLIWKRNLR